MVLKEEKNPFESMIESYVIKPLDQIFKTLVMPMAFLISSLWGVNKFIDRLAIEEGTSADIIQASQRLNQYPLLLGIFFISVLFWAWGSLLKLKKGELFGKSYLWFRWKFKAEAVLLLIISGVFSFFSIFTVVFQNLFSNPKVLSILFLLFFTIVYIITDRLIPRPKEE